MRHVKLRPAPQAIDEAALHGDLASRQENAPGADGVGAADPGFSHRVRKNGEVEVWHHGRLASTLRGRDAARFLAQAAMTDAAALQQLMARVTGNYRRGNERLAGQHGRNRGVMR